jgi:hypothetical protein
MCRSDQRQQHQSYSQSQLDAISIIIHIGKNGKLITNGQQQQQQTTKSRSKSKFKTEQTWWSSAHEGQRLAVFESLPPADCRHALFFHRLLEPFFRGRSDTGVLHSIVGHLRVLIPVI